MDKQWVAKLTILETSRKLYEDRTVFYREYHLGYRRGTTREEQTGSSRMMLGSRQSRNRHLDLDPRLSVGRRASKLHNVNREVVNIRVSGILRA